MTKIPCEYPHMIIFTDYLFMDAFVCCLQEYLEMDLFVVHKYLFMDTFVWCSLNIYCSWTHSFVALSSKVLEQDNKCLLNI